MNKLCVKSYSKINLFLKILNKRNDGYHNINSLFLELNFYDDIIFQSSQLFKFTVEGISVPKDKNNLIFKAYELIKKKYKIKKNLSIHLKKRIPLFSGLGGGSSNAATTLMVLNKIWNLNISKKELESFGSEIGADTPFFINGGLQTAEGVGNILKPIFFPQYIYIYILLIIPNIQISTKWAYKKINKDLQKEEKPYKFLSSLKQFEWELYENDFEELVISTYPEIGKIKIDLIKSGAFFASLSGSGSTMFGVYNDYDLAYKAKNKFKSYQTIQTTPKIRNTPIGA